MQFILLKEVSGAIKEYITMGISAEEDYNYTLLHN